MGKYVVFDLESEEPIKISSTVMQSDNEYSRSYIPGAVIRGAYISNYINIKNVNNIDLGLHKEKLLKGGIKFLNAYPVIDGNRSYPFPKCFFALKDDIKKYYKNKNLKVSLPTEEDSDEDIDRVKNFNFINFDFNNNVMETKEVEKINNLHIKKGTKNQLFRYEAIKAGEKFRGIIKCENDEYADEVKEVLKKGVFYIGGSKNSGYGKCNIYDISISDYNPEIENFNNDDYNDDFEDAQYFSIYASSDILYRDKSGLYKSYIDEEYLKEKLKLDEVKFKNSFIDTEYFTGFNNKWGCRLPIIKGISAGSIITYKFKGQLKLQYVKHLEEEGIGERKQDGFGRFIIFPDIEDYNSFELVAPSREHDEKTEEIQIKNEEDKEQLGVILDRIYLNKINEKIPEIILKMTDNTDLKLSQSQIGKLMELMGILRGMKYEDGINKLKGYFEHISDKKINRELSNVFEKPFIDDKSLKDYMIDELEDKVDFENKYEHVFKVGGVESKLYDGIQAMYEHKIKIFMEFFRMQLKNLKEGGEN